MGESPAQIAKQIIDLTTDMMRWPHTCDTSPGCHRCQREAEIQRLIRSTSPRGESWREAEPCRCADGFVTEDEEMFPTNPGAPVKPCQICQPETHARWTAGHYKLQRGLAR